MGCHDKKQGWSNGKRAWILCALIGIVIVGIFWGCGKLSDDVSRPSNPVGTTGGSPRTYQPTGTAGTYTLTLTADPTTILADMTNFAVLEAILRDASGRSVEGLSVEFKTAGNIGWFYEETAGSFVSTIQELTNQGGSATVRFYGSQSGSAVVEVTADLNRDGTADLLTNINVTLLPGDPPSSAGSYTLSLRANPKTIPADMATPSIIVATLTDSWADSVEGITIEFSAELGYLVNDAEGVATATETTGVTKENGTASVYYYARVPGSAVITAMASLPDLVGPLTDTVRVNVTGDPGVLGEVNIELSVQYPPNQDFITTEQTATVVARISDKDDKPLSGVNVLFSTTLGTVSPAIVAADAAGIAKTVLSSAIPGVATVYANVETVAGSSTENIEVTITEAPDAIVVTVPPPRTITLADYWHCRNDIKCVGRGERWGWGISQRCGRVI